MNTPYTTTPAREKTVFGLAIVGFIALVALGLSLAVYSTRYIPTLVNGVGSAAVYLGSIFTPSSGPGLSVIPTGTTTISFGDPVPLTPATTTTPVATTPVASGTGTSATYPGTPVIVPAPAPYGLPDLATTIDAKGYLISDATDTFVGSGDVPHGNRPAVKFTIKNVGTNWSGVWRFSASLPTRGTFVFTSDPQQSLAPGESIAYTLGFDRAIVGSDQEFTVTANFDKTVPESVQNNNAATVTLTVL